jgi:DNA invertase Pin-like site-specific DNA recombinase
MKVGLYTRVSTFDQNPETQRLDLEQMVRQRGWEIVHEYRDVGISGARARRPGLDQLLSDARKGKLDLVLTWSIDRVARSTKHFLQVLDELHDLNIQFVSFREQIDTGGPLGRAVIIIVSALAELERHIIVERVRAGMRRARLEGAQIGRRPANVDRLSVLRDRARGHSLTTIARNHHISRALVSKILRQAKLAGHEGSLPSPLQLPENRPREKAA